MFQILLFLCSALEEYRRLSEKHNCRRELCFIYRSFASISFGRFHQQRLFIKKKIIQDSSFCTKVPTSFGKETRDASTHITNKESERKRGTRREMLIPSALTTGVICHGVRYDEFTQMILRKDRGSFQIDGVLYQLASTTLFPCCFTLVDPQHPWQCSLNESVSPRNFFSQMSRVSRFKRPVTPLA